jgi:two-component system sensor histidine kinase YesM
MVTVTDDGVGMDKKRIDEIFSEGITEPSGSFKKTGILNVHKRIRYEFGGRYGLSITSEAGRYTKVTILLPDRPCED